MAVPMWVVGVALLFWGVCSGLWPVALIMGAAVVAPRWVDRRVAFRETEFARAMDMCWVLALGGLLLIYSRESVGNLFRSFAMWLPVVGFPGLLAQIWSETGRLPAGSLIPMPWWRRRVHRIPEFDVTGPFFVACVLAASVAGGGRTWFYLGLMGVAGMAFWTTRARGWRVWSAAVFLGAAMLGGWIVGLGLGGLQSWFENRFLTWVMQWRRDESVFRAARTAIGGKGDVGGSGRVLLTVRPEDGSRVPPRLRLASFSSWGNGTWYAPSSPFEKLEGAAGEWVLDPRRGTLGSAQVELRHDVTAGLLAAPGGVRTIGDCAVDTLERTGMGVVRAPVTMGVLPYRIDFAADAEWESPPTDEDRAGSRSVEHPAIDLVVKELGLREGSPREVVDRVGAFFERHFRYTTNLKPSDAKDPRATTPLGKFLLSDREGHCEYFATAGVLLVRAAGVPARYVTGFLVNPADRSGGVYQVRERHAHAWVRVWLDGKWEDFDPTPSALFGELPVMGAWDRFWNGLGFSLMRWWWLGEKRWLRGAYWLTIPLLGLTAWRFRRLRASRKRPAGSEAAALGEIRPGMDSEWFAVDRALSVRGWGRGTTEERGVWVQRLEDSAVVEGLPGLGRRVMTARALHERLRFDPLGLEERERGELRDVSDRVLRDLAVAKP